MKKIITYLLIIALAAVCATGCSKKNGAGGSGTPLNVEPVDTTEINDGDTVQTTTPEEEEEANEAFGVDGPPVVEEIPNNYETEEPAENSAPSDSADEGGTIDDTEEEPVIKLSHIFAAPLGTRLTPQQLASLPVEKTGQTAVTDYDGDGIPNDQEIFSNPYVADVPKIVTRISTPINMELRVTESTKVETHAETVTSEDTTNTSSNSMESKHYTSENLKTTPYETENSWSNAGSAESSFGYSYEHESSRSYSRSSSRDRAVNMPTSSKTTTRSSSDGKIGDKDAKTESTSSGRENVVLNNSSSFSAEHSMKHAGSANSSYAHSFDQSRMCRTTEFRDVNYTDNLSKGGVEFTSDAVKRISKNFRTKQDEYTTQEIGPNAGVVSTSLYIENLSINTPVRISNVLCSLSFRTPDGRFLPVQNFRLRNDDWSLFETEIMGSEEFGPYSVVVNNLDTHTVKQALSRGYVPQIHVISYDMEKVEDSNYNPGVNNLKIVEEIAKGRTATIKIIAPGMREIYKVSAFDVNGTSDITPGISLKKALFNIMKRRVGSGESYETDQDGQLLTVADNGLYWKENSVDQSSYVFSSNTDGNSWDKFETFVKEYKDNDGSTVRFESIKRINDIDTYNPFSREYNPDYNENEPLSSEKLLQMQYWTIYHNGEYFEGDINDPIWAGERYEIVCVNLNDYNQKLVHFDYDKLVTGKPVYLGTRWNESINGDEFDRSIYMGKLFDGDVVKLDIGLLYNRLLFNHSFVGAPDKTTGNTLQWHSDEFDYNLDNGSFSVKDGIPEKFDHSVLGKTNAMDLFISQKECAKYYVIDFAGQTLPQIKISAQELYNRRGRVVINSKTQTRIGAIEGDSSTPLEIGTIAPGEYAVNVTAYGQYPSRTYSDSNNKVEATCTVAGLPDEYSTPFPYEFSVSGFDNLLKIDVPPTEQTEYFIARYRGPYNYGVTTSDQFTEVIIPAGTNYIGIDNPAGFTPDSEKFGMYEVEVVAANANYPEGFTGNKPASQFVNVQFDPYIKQKENIPARTEKLFGKDAIDLEVNFNDGTGWYRLVLDDSDVAGSGRKIDCRRSTSMRYREQEFTLYFQPPNGSTDDLGNSFNVFDGGNDEVDLYIRTVPKKEYRDSIWLVENIADESNHLLKACIETVDRAGELLNSFLDYWLSDTIYEHVAATKIDELRSYLQFPSSSDLQVRFPSNNIHDYFFAPAVYRNYRVSALVTSKLAKENEEDIYFDVLSDTPQELIVTDLYSSDASIKAYRVFWKKTNSLNDDFSMNDILRDNDWSSETVILPDFETTNINSLEEYCNYAIAVAGITNYVNASQSVQDYKYTNPEFYGPVRVKGDQFINTPDASILSDTNISYLPDESALIIKDAYIDGEYIYGVSIEKVGSGVIKNSRLIIERKEDGVFTAFPGGHKRIVFTDNPDFVALRDDFVVNQKIIPGSEYLLKFYALSEKGDKGPEIMWSYTTVTPSMGSWYEGPAFSFDANSATGQFRDGAGLIDIINNGINQDYLASRGKQLADIVDDNNNGLPETGKFMRLLHDGQNVTTLNGLNLVPRLWDSSAEWHPSSGSYNDYSGRKDNYINIDPLTGKFALPHPCYWWKAENDNAEIGLHSRYISPGIFHGYFSSIQGGSLNGIIPKFGTAFYVSNANDEGTAWPYVDLQIWSSPDISKGTFSCWFEAREIDGTPNLPWATCLELFFSRSSNTAVSIYNHDDYGYGCQFRVNGAVVSQNTSFNPFPVYFPNGGTPVHLYVVWDSSYVKIYYNGTLVLHYLGNFSVDEIVYRIQPDSVPGNRVSCFVDNVKLWCDEIDDPSFEYNGAVGRENALHPVYGEENNYRPVNDISVGYYE